MMANQRREERLDGRGVSLWLRTPQGPVICGIDNISRIGIAIRRGGEEHPQVLDTLTLGSSVSGNLRVDKDVFAVQLRIVRVGATHLGCEMEFEDSETQRRLNGILSPRFIAKSLVPIRQNALGSHLRFAYFGADFCIMGLNESGRYQILSSGIECEFRDSAVSIRQQNADDAAWPGATDEMESYTCLPRVSVPLPELVDRIGAVLEVWEERPSEITPLIQMLKESHVV